MTPQERTLLQAIGRNFLNDLSLVTTCSVLYGIFILLFILSTSIFLRRGLVSRAAWAMFTITVVAFLLSTLSWCSLLAGFIIKIEATFVNNIDQPLDRTLLIGVNHRMFLFNVLEEWPRQFLLVVSDGVVIWRAWVLFTEQQWAMIGPIALLLGAAATSFAYCGLTSNFEASVSNQRGDYILTVNMLTAHLVLSFATNAIATLLIFYKLWTHRQSVGRLGLTQKVSPVQKVLIVIIESGALYCLLQLAILVISFENFTSESSVGFQASRVMYTIYTVFAAMYPTIVAILVNQERSLVETFGFSTVLKANGENLPAYSATGRPATRGHLSFASFPSRGPTSRLSSARPSSISSVRPVGVEHMEVGRGDFDSYRGLARGSPS